MSKPTGLHAWDAIQPTHIPSLCEANGVPEDEPTGSIAGRFSAAVQGWISGKLSESQMQSIIGARACLPGRAK